MDIYTSKVAESLLKTHTILLYLEIAYNNHRKIVYIFIAWNVIILRIAIINFHH